MCIGRAGVLILRSTLCLPAFFAARGVLVEKEALLVLALVIALLVEVDEAGAAIALRTVGRRGIWKTFASAARMEEPCMLGFCCP